MREQREIVDKFCRHRIGFKVLMKMASNLYCNARDYNIIKLSIYKIEH